MSLTGKPTKGVADADARAREIVAEADSVLADAKQTATRLRAELAERVRSAESQAESDLRAARLRAEKIIEDATARGATIAGEALRALQQADGLERTIRALHNTIDGYGDRYLIPSHTLTDDLAEEFGHTEAGERLKGARSAVRRAIASGHAAACDYVEANRRETAISFVIDAFNGKADSALSRVRHDNIGTLRQELRDAFTLVNFHGQAFRNARITEEYLTLRLEELHWAVLATELKRLEREEQRVIREQLREEEKARREIERAIKDAAKEEEMLRRAMERAERQIAKASESERAAFEAQLGELTGRLREAELRNQRAISMAQQTRRGHVYIISNVGSFGEHVYKIGLTRRLEPLDRIRELGDSSVPFEFDVHALIFAEDAPGLETRLHRHFALSQINKVNYRKEFFRVDLSQIRAEIESMGLAAKWTLAAGAREYRESLAIERHIAEDPAARDAWMKRQLTYEAVFEAAENSAAARGVTMVEDEAAA